MRLRNAWVHGPANVAADDAESFILAVRDLILHLEQVLARAGVPSTDARFSVKWLKQREGQIAAEVRLPDGHKYTVRLTQDDSADVTVNDKVFAPPDTEGDY